MPAMFTSSIDRRFGDELEARRAQFLEERAKRDVFPRGQLLEIRERKPGHDGAAGGGRDLSDAFDRRRTTAGNARDPDFAGGRWTRHRCAHIRRHVRDAHERRPGAVAPPAQIVGEHADADDIVRMGEALRVSHRIHRACGLRIADCTRRRHCTIGNSDPQSEVRITSATR